MPLQFLRNFGRRRVTSTQTSRPRLDLSPIIGGIELHGQVYDPELVAIDSPSVTVSEFRLRSGYGAPPVVPYAQKMLNNFPRLRQILRR